MNETLPVTGPDSHPSLQQMLVTVADPAVRSFVTAEHRLLIDGQWQATSSGKTLEVDEPASGEVLGHLAAGDAEDVERAVAAAARAFDDGRWSALPPAEREVRLHCLADLIEREADALATIETLDNGKPLASASTVDLPDAIRFLRYMAGWPTKLDGRSLPMSAPGASWAMTVREPVGVVAAITPWNFPLTMAVQKVASALAAGCTVVLKPAEQTSLTALRLGELALEAGIPDGVVNVVTGLGAIAGDALVRNRRVAKISFTGSTATGIRIGKTAMDSMTRLTMELGGKSPMIVLPDCDLELAAEGVIDGLFFNAGQVCCAASRLYAHADIHDALVERVAERIAALRLGPGLDTATDMGPLVSARQRDTVRRYVELGSREGGTRIGGEAWDGPGWFVRPTLFTGLTEDSVVMREEIFGPVLAVASFATQEEVVARANASSYGLGASLWSNDLAAVRSMAAQLRAGTVWVNTHSRVDPALPFGGFGLSGFGREGGPEGIEAFLETKALWIA